MIGRLKLFKKYFKIFDPINQSNSVEYSIDNSVAHSDAFGYGFRPYEYTEPPRVVVDKNSTLCEARKQAIRLGMYSLRSFILPKILSIVMRAASTCGISCSPFLIIKLFHAVLTSSLPIAVFLLSKSIHSSRDVATLSAIFATFSLSLNIFGTHTLINSFLSPVVMLTLMEFVKIIEGGSHNSKTIVQPRVTSDKQNQISNFVKLLTSIFKQILRAEKIQDHQASGEISLPKETVSTNESDFTDNNASRGSQDENANLVRSTDQQNVNYKSKYYYKEYYKSQNIAPRFGAKHIDVRTLISFCSIQTLEPAELVCGMLLAVCIYIRVDLVIIPMLIVLVNWNFTYNHLMYMIERLKSYAVGMLCGGLIGGGVDYVTYGFAFISPLQWFQFNIWNGFAGKMFGIHSCFFFITKLYQNEPLFILSLFVLLSGCIINSIDCLRNFASRDSEARDKATNQTFIIFICLLISYSTNSHKELRFLHNTIVFFYIAVSRACITLYNFLTSLWVNQNGCQYSTYCFYLFIFLFASSHTYTLFKMPQSDRANWTYGGNTDSHGENMCLDFIRHQNDVTGVFMDSTMKMAGVYSVLHKKVPIFALNSYEFMEYNYKGTYDVIGKFNSIRNNDYTEFIETSEFISIYNTPYLLKQLIDKHEYNYLVLKTDRKFGIGYGNGYVEVYRAGNSKVLKRTFEKKSEFSLDEISKDTMIGQNATVLEYEGSWLKYYGVYIKAEKRLIFANRLDPRRIGPFRILLDMYKMLNKPDSYKQVLSACVQVHTPENCLRRHSEPIVMHAGYLGT